MKQWLFSADGIPDTQPLILVDKTDSAPRMYRMMMWTVQTASAVFASDMRVQADAIRSGSVTATASPTVLSWRPRMSAIR